MHASSELHSELTTHSGLQFGGEPIIFGEQLQSQRSPTVRGGMELLPHGFGLQGSVSTGSITEVNNVRKSPNMF